MVIVNLKLKSNYRGAKRTEKWPHIFRWVCQSILMPEIPLTTKSVPKFFMFESKIFYVEAHLREFNAQHIHKILNYRKFRILRSRRHLTLTGNDH